MKTTHNLFRDLLYISILTLLLTSNSYTQENLDILPVTGRNELFHQLLIDRVDTLTQNRAEALALALNSDEAFLERQQLLYENYLMLLGDLPEKTPLNAMVIDTITSGDVYRIERLHYQSMPNHHVTANFYIPDTGAAPYPSVIITCGHYPVAKTYVDYQNLAILFAKNGIAALIVDPIAQGERYQITNELGTAYYDGGSGTTEHTLLDVGAVLTGTSVVAYELWDNHRGVDYLYSRTDVVDTSKIGCTGHSGGGAQATYLLAYDKRLKVGTVANYLTNEGNLYKNPNGGPQTGSQNLSFEGAYGIDQVDYVEMFAPKPYMIIGTTGDRDGIFKLIYVQDVYNEAKIIYDSLDAPEKVYLFETSDAHDYTTVKREASVRWFRRWFYNDNDTIIEGVQTTLDNIDLEVTGSGQVMEEWEDELSVNANNLRLADSLADNREAFWSENTKDSCLNMVKQLIVYEPYQEPLVAADSGTIDRGEYTIEKINILCGDDVPVPGLVFTSKTKPASSPAILYIDGRGKDFDAGEGEWIEKLVVDSGYIVFAVDVRGFGETTDNPAKNEGKHKNNEHRNAVISLYAGKTLIGQRVTDIMKSLDVLLARGDVDTSKINIVGIGRGGPVVMHAAALEEKFKTTTIRLSDSSWVKIVGSPNATNKMTHLVPGALKYYDLPDIVASISPRPVYYADEPVIEPSTDEVVKSLDANFLELCYPIPASGNTVILYTIPEAGDVKLMLFDSQGREVDTIVEEYQIENKYSIDYDISNLEQGMYFCIMTFNGQSAGTAKILVLP